MVSGLKGASGNFEGRKYYQCLSKEHLKFTNYASWEPSPLGCMSHAALFLFSAVCSSLALKPLVRNELIINQRSLGVCTNQCLVLSPGWSVIIPLYFPYKVQLTRGYQLERRRAWEGFGKRELGGAGKRKGSREMMSL